MLELATLGLLQKECLHGYRLKQQLELFMSGCISVNYGAIYPLLRRLEERGFISVLEEDANNSSRKIYCITNEGRQRWQEKMLEHPQESWVNARSRFMIKFFFFSHLEPTQRIQLLEHRLKVYHLHLQDRDLNPHLSDLYQSKTLQRYHCVLHDEIDWLQEQLQQERLNFKSGQLSHL